ncbi:myosin heavy chain, clone 203-like isoform X2 [Maniola hyperantus]|uniref:myosin heavy chain, clone 203-like isoform X2 n=1 Tax=Aphantopus hyperantus TaxID=2795564 RepID=UPI0037482C5C
MTKELELKTATILKESEERSKLETDLQNKAVSIEEMTKELELKTATILKENEERSKLETDLQNKAVSIEEMKMELELKASTIRTEKEERCKLETELINKTASIEEIKAEHTKLNTTMETMKEYFDVQMDTAKENEKNLKEKVSRLESGIRTKDEELSRELGNFLSKRNEFEKEKRKLKEIIDGLERKIENIVKEASKTRPAEPRMQAELDDNAVMQLTSQSDQQRFAIFADSSDEWLPRASRSTKRPRPDPLVLGEPAAAAAAASTAAVAAPEKKTKERRFFKTARKPYKKR